jgi:hypothetical protein
MIEQLTITTTPKYNFPRETIPNLSQAFFELSIQSMKTLEESLALNKLLNFQQPTIKTFKVPKCSSAQVIQISPKPDNSIVSAIDVSSIKVGETTTGLLLAIRGAIVWKQNTKYRYLRIGPFLFHITEKNKHEIYNTLCRAYFCLLHQNHKTQDADRSPNLMQMQSRLTGLLEKWLQMTITATMNDALILWDGALTAGTPEAPTRLVEYILEIAREKRNMIMAFSKISHLRFLSHRITDLLAKSRPPCLLELKNYCGVNRPIRLLGEIYVARLTDGNCAFRLDLDKKVPSELRIEAVRKLLGNDIVLQGYPETLRLAHILCTFTANEVIAMQRFVAKKIGINIVYRPNIRRILFGPYGKGE